MSNDRPELDSALYILSASKLAKDIGTGMLAFLLPLYIVGMDSSLFAQTPVVVKAGIIATVFGLSNAISQPLFGRLCDSANRRKPFIIVGTTGFVLISLIYANTDNFDHLVFLRLLQGITVGATVPAIVAMVTHMSTSGTRGTAIGVYSTLRGFGFGLGSIIGGVIATYHSFVIAFYICALLGITSLVLISLFVAETHDSVQRDKNTSYTGYRPEFVILSIAMFMMMAGIMIIFAFLPEYEQRLNTGKIYLSVAVSAYILVRILFQTPMGMLSDRIGRKKMIVLGLFLNIPVVIGLGHVESVGQLIFLRAFQGISMAAVEISVMALAVDLAGYSVGSRVSLITASQAAGMAFGPLFGGLLAGYVSFELPFYLCALLLGIALILVIEGIKESPYDKGG